MSVLYDLFENPNPDKEDTKVILHPRMVSKGTITQDEFLDRVHKFTGLSRSLLAGSMQSFCQELQDLLADGWNVEFGEMGFFYPSLQSPPVQNKQEIRADSIQLKNINFRSSLKFKKETANKMTFERCTSPTRLPKNSITIEECKARLDDYLNRNPFINSSQYGRLTGRNKQRALAELKQFMEDGFLVRHGQGCQVVYVRKKKGTV